MIFLQYITKMCHYIQKLPIYISENCNIIIKNTRKISQECTCVIIRKYYKILTKTYKYMYYTIVATLLTTKKGEVW